MKRSILLLVHLGYWCLYALLLAVIFILIIAAQPQKPLFIDSAWKQWFTLMLPIAIFPGIIGFYTAYGYLFPTFLGKRRIAAFFGASLFTIIASALLSGLLAIAMYPDTISRRVTWDGWISMWVIMGIMASIHLTIGTVVRGFITAYDDIQVKEALTRQNTLVELALVKSQIQPHFLFNTLNNIDVLIRQDAEKASEYLNKLSEILRFTLYETKDELQPLSKELEHIDLYIELQKLRTSINNYVVKRVQGDPLQVMLEPMLFLPFVENAFKHAEFNKQSEAIVLEWTIAPERVHFVCRNTFKANTAQDHPGSNLGGIGNELMRKRLELLYPQRHVLRTFVDANYYVVELEIKRT